MINNMQPPIKTRADNTEQTSSGQYGMGWLTVKVVFTYRCR